VDPGTEECDAWAGGVEELGVLGEEVESVDCAGAMASQGDVCHVEMREEKRDHFEESGEPVVKIDGC
jgi:hypothetical protein